MLQGKNGGHEKGEIESEIEAGSMTVSTSPHSWTDVWHINAVPLPCSRYGFLPIFLLRCQVWYFGLRCLYHFTCSLFCLRVCLLVCVAYLLSFRSLFYVLAQYTLTQRMRPHPISSVCLPGWPMIWTQQMKLGISW